MKTQDTLFRALPLIAVIGAAATVNAQTVYLNETFESYALDSAPAADRVTAVTVTAGTGAIGTDKVANFNDNSASGGGALEYHAGASAVGSLYVAFDIANVSPSGTGNGTNPVIFGIGAWDDSNSIRLAANASRAFGVEFSAIGDANTLKLRVGGSAVASTTYDMGTALRVQIWANDHDTNSFSFTRPDTLATGTLAANSFIVFINDVEIGTSVTGYAMNTTSGNAGDTTGNATIGRYGFNTSSTTLANFYIDNIYATDGTMAIPEPSAFAAIAGLAILGIAGCQRRRRRS